MDEQPDRSPEELPPMDIKELYEYLGNILGQSFKAIKSAYEPLLKAFSYHNPGIQSDYILWPGEEWKPPTRKELLEMKRNSNHGPRAGAKFKSNGKARW